MDGIDDGGGSKPSQWWRMMTVARSHILLGLTEIFDGKRDGVVWF
jgi:hypothetical protein